MAKRSYSKKRSKIQPAVETLTFNLGAINPATLDPEGNVTPSFRSYYLDISQSASLVNRRFYRQGLNWASSGMRITSTNTTGPQNTPVDDAPQGAVLVQKIPNTWVFSNAWEKSMRTWMRMNKDALEGLESVRPKFLDFKIFADSDHHLQGFIGNILPAVQEVPGLTTQGWVDATAGEWIASKVTIPTNSIGGIAEFFLKATGASYDGGTVPVVSLIEGYAASRALPFAEDPNTPADAEDTLASTPENWMRAIFNEGTVQSSDIIEDLLTENNQPPYPFEGDGVAIDTMYPNGDNQLSGLQLHTLENITGSTIGGVTYLKGGNFPCGLVRFDVYNYDLEFDQFNILQLELVPGMHRGYMCEPMTEM